jgi:hypothetical protein
MLNPIQRTRFHPVCVALECQVSENKREGDITTYRSFTTRMNRRRDFKSLRIQNRHNPCTEMDEYKVRRARSGWEGTPKMTQNTNANACKSTGIEDSIVTVAAITQGGMSCP